MLSSANIVIAAKTVKPHPKLPGTIFTAAKEIEESGGTALPLEVDIRDEHQVKEAVTEAVKNFGGIDILINNASAISPTGTSLKPIMKNNFNLITYHIAHMIWAEIQYKLFQAPSNHL